MHGTATLAPRTAEGSIDRDAARLVAAYMGGRSPGTLRAYGTSLRDFAAHLGTHGPAGAARALLAMSPGEANGCALGYRDSMRSRGLSPATINARLVAVRSLVRLARQLGIITWALDVPGERHEGYRDTRGPGADAVRRLLEHVGDATTPREMRDRALLHLLADMGLRRGEVVSLDVEHVDLPGRRVAVLGKGTRERSWVTMPDTVERALAAWIDARGAEPGALLTSFDRRGGGGRITSASVYKIVGRLGRAVGIEGLRPHGLRHSAITRALDLTGGDVRAVQRFSRHRDIRTVVVYDDTRRDLGGEVAALVSARAEVAGDAS